MISDRDIRAIVRMGIAESDQLPAELADHRRTWDRLMIGEEPWLEVGATLDRKELEWLIKGLTLLTRGPLGHAGSVSPVIQLYRKFRERFPEAEPALTAWIVDRRVNEYEPFGTGRFPEARSYADYLRLRASQDAVQEHRERVEAQQRIDAKARKAARATEQLPKALARGDIAAVTALLDAGGTWSADSAGGLTMVELAEKNGRTKLVAYLQSRSEASTTDHGTMNPGTDGSGHVTDEQKA